MNINPLSQALALRTLLALLLAGSILPLGGALISQFGFGLFPCEMCLLQRYPYALAGLLMIPALLYRTRAGVLRGLLWLAVALWALECGLAVYHVGIEQGWWDSATGCTAQSAPGQSLEDIKAAILSSPIVSCADVSASFAGLSMAAWNSLYAAALVGAGLLLLRKTQRSDA